MAKEKVPVITAEDVAKADAAATNTARRQIRALTGKTSEEEAAGAPPKHKHSYRKDGTCACGKVKGKK